MGQVIKIRCGKRFMILLNKNNEVFGIGSNDYGCLSDKKYKSI